MTDKEREKGRDAFIHIITFPLRLIGWIFWLILFIPRKIYTIIRSPKCIIILPILAALCYYRKDIVAMISPNAWEWLSSIYLWGGIAGIMAIRLIFKEDRRLFYKKENNMGLIQSYRQFRLARIMSLFGNITASRQLGDCFFYGHGVDIDYKRAEKYYQAAVNAGSIYIRIRAVELFHEYLNYNNPYDGYRFYKLPIAGSSAIPSHVDLESGICEYALGGNEYANYVLIKMYHESEPNVMPFHLQSWEDLRSFEEKWIDVALNLKAKKALFYYYQRLYLKGDTSLLEKLEKFADKGLRDAVDFICLKSSFSKDKKAECERRYGHFIKKFKAIDEKNRLAHEDIYAKVPMKFKKKSMEEKAKAEAKAQEQTQAEANVQS